MKLSLIGVKVKNGDFQKNTVCFALVLESDNRCIRDMEMGICICFEN